MIHKLRAKTKLFGFYEPSEIPKWKDCWLYPISSHGMVISEWLKYSARKNYKDGSEVSDHLPCAISSETEEFLNLDVLINRSDRFHTIKLVLPKKLIFYSYLAYTSHNSPIIVVDQKWFDMLKKFSYSVYGLIDFIGIKSLVTQKGEFDLKIVNGLYEIVDQYANNFPQFTFLTFADNIIIKDSWKSDYLSGRSTYNPEIFVDLIIKLMKELRIKLRINSYSIFTQGANYIDEANISTISRQANHFILPSLAMQFIEIYEIENDARLRIRNKSLKPSDLYFEKSFFISLKLKIERDLFKYFDFVSTKLKYKIKYLPLNIDEYDQIIKN